ncbi:MAG: hypothetical protein R3A79_21800, partial [Nannocystaceae bacterium]
MLGRLSRPAPIALLLVAAACTGGASSTDTDTDTDTASSSSSTTTGEAACEPADEGVTIPDAPFFDAGGPLVGDLAAVPCEVTADGLLCVIDGGDQLLDFTSVFAGFAPLPWANGDNVSLSVTITGSYAGTLVIRSDADALLALGAWSVAQVDASPLAVVLEDIGCEGDPPPLRATYTVGDESVALVGAAKASLGGLAIFQERAADISGSTAGEFGDVV